MKILLDKQLSKKIIEKVKGGKKKDFPRVINFTPLRDDYYNLYIDGDKIIKQVAIYKISEENC